MIINFIQKYDARLDEQFVDIELNAEDETERFELEGVAEMMNGFSRSYDQLNRRLIIKQRKYKTHAIYT